MKPGFPARARLYGFVDMAYVGARDPAEVAQALLAGGADLLQLRAKKLPPREIAEIARRILPLSRRAGVPLVINDFADLARAVGADGVHLGQEDAQKISVAAARDLLGPATIVGLSTHSVEQARAALFARPDYIGFGPIFPTGTKPGRAAVGLSALRALCSMSFPLPFFAIGGITQRNLRRVLAAGARRVAVVSAMLCAADTAAAARQFKRRLS